MNGGSFKPKVKRMFSGTSPYHRFDIARGQLETAIKLFLIDGADMFSAITLAGAAGAILHTLVLNEGKIPMVDHINDVGHQKAPDAPRLGRAKVIKHVHEQLSINYLKHFDEGDDPIIEFDAEESALAAILKAMADYKTFTGELTTSMQALLAWTVLNLDSAEIIEKYELAKKEGRVPEQLGS